jgi:hypothetical protein
MMNTLLVLAMLGASPAEPPPPHQLEVYLRSGLTLFSSPARTQGGAGGGLGLRDTVNGRWVLQADVNGLMGMGTALEVRLGAGLQREGWWSPMARLELSGVLGQQLRLLSPDNPRAAPAASLALGVALAPLRFNVANTRVSALELNVGAGPDSSGLGLRYGVTLLEIGIPL